MKIFFFSRAYLLHATNAAADAVSTMTAATANTTAAAAAAESSKASGWVSPPSEEEEEEEDRWEKPKVFWNKEGTENALLIPELICYPVPDMPQK